MSYSHTQRRKTVRRFKAEFVGQLHPDRWYLKFRTHVEQIVRERLGPQIGTLEDIVNEAKRQGKWLNPRKIGVNSLAR